MSTYRVMFPEPGAAPGAFYAVRVVEARSPAEAQAIVAAEFGRKRMFPGTVVSEPGLPGRSA